MKINLLLMLCVYLVIATGIATGQTTPDLAQSLGISFPADSQSTVILTRNGSRYLIDTANKTVKEVTAAQASVTQPSSRPVLSGAPIFAKNCAGCHGPDGKGIKGVGTPNFTDPAFARSVSASEIQTTIHNGISGRMPAWSGKLSDIEISELVVYVRSLAPSSNSSSSNDTNRQSSSALTADAEARRASTIYQPGDDYLVSLPTGRATDRHGVYMNFQHRFPYDPAFTGTNRGGELFGLDGVALPSLGVRYGVTDNLSVSIFRAPSLINRPIQLMAGYTLLQEQKGDPLNLMVRVSIEGQNNFQKNYTENIEGILSRSVTKRAQVYLVPTISLNDRELTQPAGFGSDQIADVPGVNAFSLGVGLSVDIRPTVALMAEVIPTLINGPELGIHRPAFSFGIQKKIWRHAFTLAVTNSPGTTVSQRAATRAQFLGDPSADTFGGLVLGFNITRQIR